jgi:hypothetical protein
MTWDILILTMSTRQKFIHELLKVLEPQRNDQVNILIRTCDPQYTLGENRDMLRRSSRAQYINFVDDDDMVPDDYVSTILPLLDGVDQIGFQLQCYIDGRPLSEKTFHSLQFNGWYQDVNGYYRDISHLNSMRRELALLEPMEGGHGEDKRWSDRMRGKVKTEHYIPRVMYHYYFNTKKNQGAPCPKCGSESTVLVEIGTHCNGCGVLFAEHPIQKSCLWV